MVTEKRKAEIRAIPTVCGSGGSPPTHELLSPLVGEAMKKAHATKTWAMPVAKQWQGRHGPGKWHLYCWDPFKQKRRRSYDAGGWSAHGKPWHDSQREADLDCDRYRQWLSGELKASLAGRPVGSRPSVFPSENRAANASAVTTCASASPTLPLLQTADPAHIPGFNPWIYDNS